MRVVMLAAGAAGMYCGSCLRDNRVAARLIEKGRDVTLIPLYTPLRTDEAVVAQGPIHFGGLNVYLKQKWPLLHRTPRFVERWLDSPGLLRFLSRFSSMTKPEDLGSLAVAVLGVEHGPLQSELSHLVDALKRLKSEFICLPNLMFLGVGRILRRELGVPVCCTLSGEDLFLDQLAAPFKSRAFSLIRQWASDLDGYLSTTHYYAEHSADHFGIRREKITVVPLGVDVSAFGLRPEATDDLPTIGYLARLAPEKGLEPLVRTFVALRREGVMCRLRVAGYVGPEHRRHVEGVRRIVREAGLAADVEILGEVTFAEKRAFLHSVDVLSVPTVMAEAKGLYVLEALACGVPVVQPHRGSFPELIDATGGGLLFEPGNQAEHMAALRRLLTDHDLRRRMGAAGREVVLRGFTDQIMADRTWEAFEALARSSP